MFTTDSLAALQEAAIAKEAHAIMDIAGIPGEAVALPGGFSLVDLEPYQAIRRRWHGSMTTSSLASFVKFSKDTTLEEGSSCFVNSELMKAVVIFNLGDADAPGHADHTATLALEKTAEYRSLLNIVSKPRTQKDLAEWLEDMSATVTAVSDAGEVIDIRKAIMAVRKIDINASRKIASEQNNLSATRTTFESIEARSEHDLPAQFSFECVPYKELASRGFDLRLSVLTGGDVPMMALHIRRAEIIAEEMAQELVDRLEVEITTPIYIGTYSSK